MTDGTLHPPATQAPGFDPVALRRRYDQERDRRLRADGNAQYVELSGEFAHYLADPWADPGFEDRLFKRPLSFPTAPRTRQNNGRTTVGYSARSA